MSTGMGYVVAITGKAGAGKSTLLTNLAYMFSMSNYLTVCLSTDLRYPSLPFFFQGAQAIAPKQSIGYAFLSANPASMVGVVKNAPNLFVASTSTVDECRTFEPPEGNDISKYLESLASVYNIVFVEAEDVQFNLFSMRAVREADMVINVINGSTQGLLWEQANRRLLQQIRSGRKIYNVLSVTSGDMTQKTAESHLKERIVVTMPSVGAELMTGLNDQGVLAVAARAQNRKLNKYAVAAEQLASIIANGGTPEELNAPPAPPPQRQQKQQKAKKVK